MSDLISRQAALIQNSKIWRQIADLPSAYPTVGKNVATDYDPVDQFICSKCGIELRNWARIERDDDDGDETYHEYRFRYCPNCGAVIDDE